MTYTENAVPVLIASAGTVTDLDLQSFDTGTLTVSFVADGNADDRLSIKNVGTGLNQISISGSDIVYNAVTIGSFSGGTSGTDPLVITFNSGALAAGVATTLKAITFNNLSDNPPTTATVPRTVQFVLTDGHGGTSNTANRLVKITAVNDKPVVTTSASTVGYTENGTPFFIIDLGATIVDVDSSDFDTGKLTAKISANSQTTDRLGIESSGLISASSGTVSYNGTPIGTYAGTATLTITLNAVDQTATQTLLRHITFSSIETLRPHWRQASPSRSQTVTAAPAWHACPDRPCDADQRRSCHWHCHGSRIGDLYRKCRPRPDRVGRNRHRSGPAVLRYGYADSLVRGGRQRG